MTVELRERWPRRPALTLALPSGQERRLVVHRKWDSTDSPDDPWQSLRQFLGARFTVRSSAQSDERTGSRVGVS